MFEPIHPQGIGLGGGLYWEGKLGYSKNQKTAGISFFLFLCLKSNAQLIAGPMVGHTDHQSSSIWAHAGQGKTVELKWGIAGAPESQWVTVSMPPRPERKFTSLGKITGLSPKTQYRFQVLVNGSKSGEGAFATAPLPYQPAKFTFLLTSCMSFAVYPKQVAWTEIIKHPFDFSIMGGDNVYSNTTNRDTIFQHHMTQRGIDDYPKVLNRAPTWATWDDHDYGPNDAHGTTPGKEKSLEAFKDVWAHPAYGTPEIPGVFYDYYWGNAHFIVLDDRYYRTDETLPNSPGKTMYGPKQLAWFFDKLKNSRAPFKVVVKGASIVHGSYPDEVKIISKFIGDNKIYGVVFTAGDIHVNDMRIRDTGMGYPLVEYISSGVAKHPLRPWALMDMNTTLPDPTISGRFFHQEAYDSTVTFALSQLTPPGISDVLVNSPTGGEKFTAGSIQEISWTKVGQGIAQVRLEYSTGSTWKSIGAPVSNTGKYNWTVPNDVSSTVKIRITNASGTESDESRATFEIEKAVSVHGFTSLIPCVFHIQDRPMVSLQIPAEVREISIWNSQGKLVHTQKAGGGNLYWNRKDESGVLVLPGFYFLKLATTEGVSNHLGHVARIRL